MSNSKKIGEEPKAVNENAPESTKDETPVNDKFTGPRSEFYEAFAKAFLWTRTSKGLSSTTMADMLGVHKARYSRLENKRNPPTLDNIIDLLMSGDLTPNEVFGYTEYSSDMSVQAHEMVAVLQALPRDSFDFIGNVILHEVKSLKRPKVAASKRLSVPEVFEILEDFRTDSTQQTNN